MNNLMKRLGTIAATVALVVTPLALPANAAIGNCEVTSNADSGAGTLRDCFSKVVVASGYEGGINITFASGVTAIALNSPIAISVEEQPEFLTITVDGPISVSASNSFSTGEEDRLLDISVLGSGTLWLEEVTFTNAPHGAISLTGTNSAWLYLFDSTFTDNDTVSGSSETTGAAVYLSGVSADIQSAGSTFTGNSAYSDGGAIAVNAALSTITLTDDHFTSNTSGGKGGAISAPGAVVVSTFAHDDNPLFSSNTATTAGGAIWANGNVDSMYATFSGNTAGTSGGAIYSDLGDVAVYNSTFTTNSSQHGGAIRVLDGFFDSTRSHFGGNSATWYGGAVRVDGSSGDVNTITQSSFVDNTTGFNGGALLASQPVKVGHSTFYSNDAGGNGGGMIVTAGLDLAFVTMVDNTAVNGPDVYIVAGETSSIGSVYASSTALDTTSRFTGGMSNLYPGNFSTGLEGVFTNTGNLQGATYADFDFGSLQQFTELKFNYDYTLSTTINTTKGFVPGANSTLLGAVTDEDLSTFQSDGGDYSFITDQQGDDLVIEGPYTAGAIHVVDEGDGGGGGDDDSGDVPSDPTSPNLSITKVSKGSIAAAGDSFVVYGKGLKDVTEVFIGSTKVTFAVQADGTLKVTSPALALGQYDLKVVGPGGQAVLLKGLWVVDTVDFSTWTKRSGDSIKIYAKNVIGAGKVQFFVDGREIAWINAVDGSDPKLRTANGFHYLVRSVELKASGAKTRFEVKLNGERVRRNTYTIYGN